MPTMIYVAYAVAAFIGIWASVGIWYLILPKTPKPRNSFLRRFVEMASAIKDRDKWVP